MVAERHGYNLGLDRSPSELSPESEQAVDEWGERRSRRKHKQTTEAKKEKNDRCDPPFLADLREAPELAISFYSPELTLNRVK